jgi:hypothetical protein
MPENKEPESFKDIVAQLYICLKESQKEETEGMLRRSKISISKIQYRIAELKKYFSENLDSYYIDEMIELTSNISYLVKLEKDINRRLKEYSQTE